MMDYNNAWAQRRLGVAEGFTQTDDKARVAAAFPEIGWGNAVYIRDLHMTLIMSISGKYVALSDGIRATVWQRLNQANL